MVECVWHFQLKLVKPYVCNVVGVVRMLNCCVCEFSRKRLWLVYCLTMSAEGSTYWSESILEYSTKMIRS